MKKVKIGLYGDFGHQIYQVFDNPRAEVVAAALVDPGKIPERFRKSVRFRPSLEALLATDAELISLASPRRENQELEALRALEAGKHGYAEKPCAFHEAALDRIISLSRRKKLVFHEMAGAAFESPSGALRHCVQSGTIGEVLEVCTQKAYPWFDGRCRDENADGGLLRQVGIYNLRFTEHITGIRVTELFCRESTLGNHGADSECRRAVSFSMKLANGGLASGIANYCGPRQPQWPCWGYESVRIFGSNGFAEAVNLGETLRYCTPETGIVPLDPAAHCIHYLDAVLEEIQTGVRRIPVSLEEELHPTRWVIRAKLSPETNLR